MAIILSTSIMLRNAYLQRAERKGNKLIPVVTYNLAYAKTFRSVESATKLLNALYWNTLRDFYVCVK